LTVESSKSAAEPGGARETFHSTARFAVLQKATAEPSAELAFSETQYQEFCGTPSA
jgi:hypothetical protein